MFSLLIRAIIGIPLNNVTFCEFGSYFSLGSSDGFYFLLFTQMSIICLLTCIRFAFVQARCLSVNLFPNEVFLILLILSGATILNNVSSDLLQTVRVSLLPSQSSQSALESLKQVFPNLHLTGGSCSKSPTIEFQLRYSSFEIYK